MCLSDAEMYECAAGHTFCEDHLVGDRGNDDRWDMPKAKCPICTLVHIRDQDMTEFLLQKFSLTRDAVKEEMRAGGAPC